MSSSNYLIISSINIFLCQFLTIKSSLNLFTDCDLENFRIQPRICVFWPRKLRDKLQIRFVAHVKCMKTHTFLAGGSYCENVDRGRINRLHWNTIIFPINIQYDCIFWSDSALLKRHEWWFIWNALCNINVWWWRWYVLFSKPN